VGAEPEGVEEVREREEVEGVKESV